MSATQAAAEKKLDEAKGAVQAMLSVMPPCTMDTDSRASLALLLVQKITEQCIVLQERVRLLEEEIKNMKRQH